MISRRTLLTSVPLSTISALAFPAALQQQWDFEKSRILNLEFPADGDPGYWTKMRRLFPMPADETFFNTGTLGAMPTAVLNTMTEHMRQVNTEIAHWDYTSDDWISGYQAYRKLRERLGQLMKASIEEIALTENATAGMNLVSNGLDLASGAEILGTDQEHPGGKSGWEVKAKRHAGSYRPVTMPKPPRTPEEVVELFKSAITPKTRVIAIPHMISATGTILPVREICAEARQRGIFTIIDGAQAFGHIAVDVRDLGCDAYYASLHKWFLAPPGTGFLYIRKEQIKEVWTTLASGQWDNHEDDGFRLLQRGTGNLSTLMGLSAAIDFHQRVGPQRVQQRIKFLGDRLREGLKGIRRVTVNTSPHPAMCAGITSFQVEGLTGTSPVEELWKRRKIRMRSSRLSTHIYNSEAEIDTTLEIVRDLAK